MTEYKFADKDGSIVISDYKRSEMPSQEDVQEALQDAFRSLGNNEAEVKPVNDDMSEVYEAIIPYPDMHKEIIYICAKGMTPGGRNGLKNEQRIQQKAKYLNYVYEKHQKGNKAVNLGVYKRNGVTVFCAWKLSASNAASEDTPISKQIKIETIAKAITDGFVQQKKSGGELACAFRQEFIYFYLQNSEWIHSGVVSQLAEHTEPVENDQAKKNPVNNEAYCEPVYHTDLKTKYPLNRIVFGAPGTGKSYQLEQDRKEILEEDAVDPEKHIGDYERVTFHPDYTYSQFVGTYKPVSVASEDYDIQYKFVPGPFMRVYVKAIADGIKAKEENRDAQPFVLIIEEINRAPVAAVFGDVFQLLDREDGVSQYAIETNEDIRGYLASTLGGNSDDYEKIKIPDNMFIWATMNSADQGVFPMDTAFKRRWDFKYLGVDENDRDIRGKYVVVGDSSKEQQRIEWNSLRKAINDWLASQKINEDKQLGPYFISRSISVPETGNEIDRDRFAETFKNKVLMYLFEDAARQKRSQLFSGAVNEKDGKHDVANANRYSEICAAFDSQGIGIFNQEIQAKVSSTDLYINGHKVNAGEEPEE